MALTMVSKYSNLSLCICLEDSLHFQKSSLLGELIVDETFGLENITVPPGLEVCWISSKKSVCFFVSHSVFQCLCFE